MTSTNPRFKQNKALVVDLMRPGFLAEVSAPEIYSKVKLLLKLWSKKTAVAKGKPFEARKDIIDAALDIINAAAFAWDEANCTVTHQLQHLASSDRVVADNPDGSVDFSRAPDTADAMVVHDLGRYLGEQIVSPAPQLAHFFNYWTNSKLRATIAAKEAILTRETKKALDRLQGDKSGEEGGRVLSALDHLLKREMESARKAGREPKFFTPEMRDETWGYLVGGHETSATAISWQVKILADHPDIQKTVRSHLHAAFPDALAENRLPTAKEITSSKIPYLDAFLEETLRFCGPVQMLGRQAYQDAMVLGHLIPKGTFIFMPLGGPTIRTPGFPVDDAVRSETSRTKSWGGRWGDDIAEFRPERWLKEGDEGETEYDIQSGPIMAFGLGPRSCFGKRLAYLEMRIVLVLLVWKFQFNKVPEALSDYDAHDSITTVPLKCYVALEELC